MNDFRMLQRKNEFLFATHNISKSNMILKKHTSLLIFNNFNESRKDEMFPLKNKS